MCRKDPQGMGGIMSEPTNQAATIQHDTASLATPDKRRNSALDRGFPSGKILLGLAALIILLQGIAAWKVVNLEQERAAVARSRAILEKDRQALEEAKEVHGPLLRELPGLKAEVSDLKTERSRLQGDVEKGEKRLAGLKAELPEVEKRVQELRAIIEQSGTTINALEKTIGGLKGEIPEKTSELSQLKQDIENSRTQQKLLVERRGVLNSEVSKLEKDESILQTKRDGLQAEIKRLTAELDRLTGPSSDLARSMDIFKSILEEFKKSPAMVDAAINQVIIGMNSQIDKLKDANSNVGATNQELQKTQKTLSLSTGELSQTLVEFKIAAKTLGDSVKGNTADLQRSTGEISKVANTMQATAATLSATMQGFQQTGRDLSQKATEVSQEIDKLKAITQGLQQTGNDLSRRATEVSQPLNDLNTVTKDVQRVRDSFIPVMDSLSKLINAFKSATDALTSQSGELVGNTVQLKTSNAALSLRLQELEQTGNALKTTYERLSKLLEEFAAAVPKSPNEENRKPN